MNPQVLDKRTLDAGARACEQLVRAVSSATSSPLRRAAAGSALARLHQLLIKNRSFIIAGLQSGEDVLTTVSALVEVYSLSLREVARQTPMPAQSAAGEDQAQLKDSKVISGTGSPEPHAAQHRQQRPGSGRDSRGAESTFSGGGNGSASGHGAGPFPEDWVPLLVDSSALVANCLYNGGFTITPTAAASGSRADAQLTEVYACNTSPLASALLLSDALPALSRLLSAEAQRGCARALLTPRQLATCLQPLGELIAAAAKLHDDLVPISPQGVRKPHHPAPSPTTTTTTSATTTATATTTPALSPVPPAPAPTSSTSAPPAAGPSTTALVAAKPFQGTETCPEPLPVPQGHERNASISRPTLHQSTCLGGAMLCALAESGVVEAACRAALGALEQVAGRRQQPPQRHKGAACVAGGDREELLAQLLELPRQLLTWLWSEGAASLPTEPLRTILTAPCVQYALAAHSVSQLHAVDGGTTYGLPHDSLLPPLREEGKDTLACYGAINALCWWMRTCASGGFQLSSRPLSSRGVFELCLRGAEVAADCWRRRHGLSTAEAAAAAAGGLVRDSGGGGSSRGGESTGSGGQRGQGVVALVKTVRDTGRQAGRCRTGCAVASTPSRSSGRHAADLLRAMLEPRDCPDLALQAVNCSLALMCSTEESDVGEAEARALQGTGSSTGSSRMNRIARFGNNTTADDAAQGAGGGCGARGGGSGNGIQSSSSTGEGADGCANVGVSGGGRRGQGGGADAGGCGDVAEEACSSASGRDSGRGCKGSVAWLRDGGPLARRWWRAAVAAVHCAMDELAVNPQGGDDDAGSRSETGFTLDQVLDPSLAMPVSDPGPALPAAPPPSLCAALDAGYLPCLERTLRTCFRACNTPDEAIVADGVLFNDDTDMIWPLLLALGDEREAAAFLATAAKVARRACQERARPGGDRKACSALMGWMEGMSSNIWRAADHVVLRVAVEQGLWEGQLAELVQEQGRETAAIGSECSGDGGGAGGGGGGSGSGSGSGGGGGGDGGDGGCGSGGGGGGGGGDGDGSIRASGNGGDINDASANYHSSSSDGGSSGDGRCVRGAGDTDTGAGACGGEDGVRSGDCASGGGCSDSGGGGDRGGGRDGCGDGFGGGGCSRCHSGDGSTGNSAALPARCTGGGCGTAAAAAAIPAVTAATTSAAGSLSPPEQQLLRLLSFALPLWLPLWLDLASAMTSDGRLTRSWRADLHRALEDLAVVQQLCVGAVAKKDLRAAESWRRIVGWSREEVEGMLDGCRRVLEREEAAAELLSAGGRGAGMRAVDGITAEKLRRKMEDVTETAFILGADFQDAVVARGKVEGGEPGEPGLSLLAALGLLSPPCDARQVLACCSNPRCAELAGDSEAGVVLRRCGGACGGAAAYCCAACQRAHWAAGHREECTAGNRRGGAEAGAAGAS